MRISSSAVFLLLASLAFVYAEPVADAQPMAITAALILKNLFAETPHLQPER